MNNRMRETNLSFPLLTLTVVLAINVPGSNEFPKDDFFLILSDVTHFTLFNN